MMYMKRLWKYSDMQQRTMDTSVIFIPLSVSISKDFRGYIAIFPHIPFRMSKDVGRGHVPADREAADSTDGQACTQAVVPAAAYGCLRPTDSK